MNKSVLIDEIDLVNNEALGAYLMWKYATAYNDGHLERQAMPGILGFLLLPIIYHRPTYELLKRTQLNTGLAKFSEKFLTSEKQASDLLLSIQGRCNEMKILTWRTMLTADSCGLIKIHPESGRIFSRTIDDSVLPKGVPYHTTMMANNSIKLGKWFSQEMLTDISYYLKVKF